MDASLETSYYPNVNALWAAVAVATFARLGGEYAVISPGSRSTPLTIALAKSEEVKAIPVLDERSAAFYALGLAKRTRKPVILVCTSGTAGANYYPAVIEAHEAGVPLLVLTADRPAEMRYCSSGQTIDQQKLFGDYVRFYKEIALPEKSEEMLRYLRQTMVNAFERCLYPEAGPVHLNFPFRDPLALEEVAGFSPPEGFKLSSFVSAVTPAPAMEVGLTKVRSNSFVVDMLKSTRGVIVVGANQPDDPEEFAVAISLISKRLGWPVLADALNPLRNYEKLNPYLITQYDLVLRNSEIAKGLQPEAVLSIGQPPISKVLRSWLETFKGPTWLLETRAINTDPLHRNATSLRMTVEGLAEVLDGLDRKHSAYADDWLTLEQDAADAMREAMQDAHEEFEGRIARLLSWALEKQRNIFVANSMPVRDMEYFWLPNNRHHRVFVNRGANGIDGTLSTAMGLAHEGEPSILLSGDLAFLHDTNGMLNAPKFKGSLSVIVINNNGGGIFEALPVSRFDPPFEEYFATPQQVNLEKLVAAYGIAYRKLESINQLGKLLNEHFQGIRVLEVKTSRKTDMEWRKMTFVRIARELKL